MPEDDERLLDVQAFRTMCEANKDKAYVQDLIDVLNSADSTYNKGFIASQEHLASLYRFRFGLAKKYGSRANLQNYEDVVVSLEQTSSTEIGAIIVGGNSKLYLLFYEPQTQIILGILGDLKRPFVMKPDS